MMRLAMAFGVRNPCFGMLADRAKRESVCGGGRGGETEREREREREIEREREVEKEGEREQKRKTPCEDAARSARAAGALGS